jgi:magnesium-transporting ATPase (P-type)
MTMSPHLVDAAPPAGTDHGDPNPVADSGETVDERRPLVDLFRDLRTSSSGLSVREAARRQLVYGPNTLTRRTARRWPRELLGQFTQPLAILLALAAVLAWIGGTPALAVAVVAVILLNAGFAFVQEMQAERAVEALAAFLPATARVVRDEVRSEIAARDLVPGDVLIVAEGDRVCADARIIDGTVTLDLSALTGESLPVTRSAEPDQSGTSLLDATDLLFSGTTCTVVR